MSAKNFDRYMRQIDARLGAKQVDSTKWVSDLPLQAPGLTELLNSFAVGSPQLFEPDLEEWNPLSQRPIYVVPTKLDRDISFDFQAPADVVYRFIILAHEAMHVLMWEPFFCGKLRPTKSQFTFLSLAFEGFCFWYADIYINGKIDVKSPDREKVFTRSSVSQTTIHPMTAFKNIGMTDLREILNTYIRAFTGYETDFSKRATNPLVRTFAERFYTFHSGTLKPPKIMFEAFEEIGLFGEFYERFCSLEGIPSLFSEGKIATLKSIANVEEYCWEVFSQRLEAIAHLPRGQVQRVQMRRSLQTRAYFALTARAVLTKRLYKTENKFNRHEVLTQIEKYLSMLEEALKRLCAGRDLSEIAMLQRKADLLYSRAIRQPMKVAKAFSTRREQIQPELPGYTRIQLREDRSHLAPKTLSLFAKGLLNLLLNQDLGVSKSSRKFDALVKDTRLATELILQINSPGSKATRTRAAASLSLVLDRILSNQLIFERWSTALHLLDPAKNSFRELMFNYK